MLFDAHIHLGEIDPRERMLPGAALCSIHALDDPLLVAPRAEVLLSYGIHPLWIAEAGRSLAVLETLAAAGKIAAVGECGFDFYQGRDAAKEQSQREVFQTHCAIAAQYRLPLVIHVRRGMAEVFAETAVLKRIPAVIFHCYPGSAEEGRAFLKRGVNAFFSFGTPLLKHYPGTIAALQALPRERILLETDAPFQPPRGQDKTLPADLAVVYEAAARLRNEDPAAWKQCLWETACAIFPALSRLTEDA